MWFPRVVDLIEGPGVSHTRAEELHEVWKHSTATQSCFLRMFVGLLIARSELRARG